jgi:hypothetical protein
MNDCFFITTNEMILISKHTMNNEEKELDHWWSIFENITITMKDNNFLQSLPSDTHDDIDMFQIFSKEKKKKRKKNFIIIQKKILNDWFVIYSGFPFPTETEDLSFSIRIGITSYHEKIIFQEIFS